MTKCHNCGFSHKCLVCRERDSKVFDRIASSLMLDATFRENIVAIQHGQSWPKPTTMQLNA